jgi:hypothetical protein
MADFAIFTRNYRQHLATIKERVVFRSNVRWARAARALEEGDAVDVYIAPVDGNGEVEFRAKLSRVLLEPHTGEKSVKEMLAYTPETTAGEGLWDGELVTLYEVTMLEKVDPPFHFTKLRKLNNGVNIDPGYSRSYCIVKAID